MILKCCAQTTLDKPEGGEQKAQAEASSFAGIQDDSDYRCFQTDFYLTQTHWYRVIHSTVFLEAFAIVRLS